MLTAATAAKWLTPCAAVLFAASATAVDIDRVDVQHKGARYRVEMQVRLDAPAQRAYAVLTDFSNLGRFNPAVRRSQELPSVGPGTRRLFTEINVCVSFICRKLEQVQDMRLQTHASGGTLSASVVPALSNLQYGQADWDIHPCAAQSCLRFIAELEPKFWIPPLIGPWLIQRKLRQEAIQTSEGIERLAQQSAADTVAGSTGS